MSWQLVHCPWDTSESRQTCLSDPTEVIWKAERATSGSRKGADAVRPEDKRLWRRTCWRLRQTNESVGGSIEGLPSSDSSELQISMKREVYLCIEQFRNVEAKNKCSNRKTQLWLGGYLDGPIRTHCRKQTAEGVLQRLYARYGTSTQQANGHLLNIKKDSQRSVFDFFVVVSRLVAWDAPIYLQKGVMCGLCITLFGHE